ncbi:UDP-N-acetylmuramoyl-L-alanine--D-glutamate ligase [Candidatus Sulfidibacterium hydrothermale]|uniref:UDP-N-acetylmuramoyl-L-alanine--D-glutamate ligase n=1 Tax=Candidatus Sulfidibacterium hydrothermale TaxID=2875962 RepID=UPI001F0B68FC|nr:UDP-N-acetylmuramoyl-L-alanine--D-glutamate ligase [Candidatus Sulfidibacterium hydrothermale]UBM63061.1 UDP-N-acetylmuramoyl-L-alanine--D-glutamate ligase [Candidatus Sulfidibacterium hydrothermale]
MKTTDDIVVLGAGESGTGAAVLAKKKGLKVFVSDKGKINEKYRRVLTQFDIDFEENGHTFPRIFSAQKVVKSPGIPDTVPFIQQLHEKGIPVISEIEFAAAYTRAKKIAITGSNGKTTTTLLTYHILKKAGMNVGLAGNVGKSFAWQVAFHDFDWYVLEISSFQLDGMVRFKADIAILLNITPDHLDRYNNDFQQYVDSKFRILQNQTADDYFIYWDDDPVIKKELKKRKITAVRVPFGEHCAESNPGAGIINKKIRFNNGKNSFDMTLEQLALQGKHNTYNSMASGVAAHLMEIRKETIKQSLSDFQNIAHRLEYVASVHGITFINDSKATNVNSTWYALEYMEKPVIWIVGGVDKGNDYDLLKPLVAEKVKGIVCLGLDNRRIHQAFEGLVDTIIDTESAREAVATAYYLAKKGDVVLLSPACASFDLFENYEDRGNQFKAAVNEL